MMVRARLYAEVAIQVRQLAAGSDPMADAADADQVPVAVLADYVEDMGGEAGALREAFAGE